MVRVCLLVSEVPCCAPDRGHLEAVAAIPPGPAADFTVIRVNGSGALLVHANGIGRVQFILHGVMYDVTGPAVSPQEAQYLASAGVRASGAWEVTTWATAQRQDLRVTTSIAYRIKTGGLKRWDTVLGQEIPDTYPNLVIRVLRESAWRGVRGGSRTSHPAAVPSVIPRRRGRPHLCPARRNRRVGAGALRP